MSILALSLLGGLDVDGVDLHALGSRLRAVLGRERVERGDLGYRLHYDWLDVDERRELVDVEPVVVQAVAEVATLDPFATQDRAQPAAQGVQVDSVDVQAPEQAQREDRHGLIQPGFAAPWSGGRKPAARSAAHPLS